MIDPEHARLEPLPGRRRWALAVVARPEELQYGWVAAVGVWTYGGHEVRLRPATHQAAGIDPVVSNAREPLGEREQRASAAVVGVSSVEYPDHRDGAIAYGNRAVRARRGGGRRQPGIFPELTAQGPEPCNGRPPDGSSTPASAVAAESCPDRSPLEHRTRREALTEEEPETSARTSAASRAQAVGERCGGAPAPVARAFRPPDGGGLDSVRRPCSDRDGAHEDGLSKRGSMDDEELLADRFQAHRGHLRAVAYRMLGSLSEADDALQETWLRLSRSDVSEVRNLAGWLTTVVGRICLDMLRSRTARREDPMVESFVPDPVIAPLERVDPEQEVLLADSVGLALLVVLETLEPAERLAFVLHDMFAVPFDDIAPIAGRTSTATRQLASRARRRVQSAEPATDPDLGRQREAVEAFLAASRAGDFDALVAVLDPDVVLRADSGPLVTGLAASKVARGAATVAKGALMFRQYAQYARFALVNGSIGLVTAVEGRPMSVMGVTVVDGRITGIYILADPERLGRLDFAAA